MKDEEQEANDGGDGGDDVDSRIRTNITDWITQKLATKYGINHLVILAVYLPSAIKIVAALSSNDYLFACT
ncbi:hypothetical protein BLOT_007152 [Blomia tropicalis]|nr:hypothetical protein BLOT_007152 [Blomia tropicalis]